MAGEKHLLLTWGGDYTDTQNSTEVWQNSLRLALVFGNVDDVGTLPSNWDPVAASVSRTETHWTITSNWTVDGPGTQTFSPDDFLNDQVAPALDTWVGQSGIADRLRLRWVKCFPIGSNGRAVPAPPYSQGTPCLLEWTSSYPLGDDGGNMLPLQCAGVVSHRSNQTGRRGRGRVFRGGLSVNANDIHAMIPSTIAGYWKDAEIALLEAVAINVGSGPGDLVKTRPAVIGSPWTQYGVITQVRVGDRVDTQRRRRAQLEETYVSGTPSY